MPPSDGWPSGIWFTRSRLDQHEPLGCPSALVEAALVEEAVETADEDAENWVVEGASPVSTGRQRCSDHEGNDHPRCVTE